MEYKVPRIDDSPPKSKEETPIKKKPSVRKVISAILIVLIVGSMVALIVLGLEYFPIREKEDICSVFVFTDTPTTDYEKRCVPTNATIESVCKVKIQSRRGLIERSLDLKTTSSLDIWIFKDSSTSFSVEVNVSKVTCYDEGVYSFEYIDVSNKIVMNQTKTLRVDGNLSEPVMKTIPHIAEDGKSKVVYIECSMNTGCRHGILVPQIHQNNNEVTFIDKASCSYEFTKKQGGIASCSTYIPGSVWVIASKVKCPLTPEPETIIGIPSKVEMKTSDLDLIDTCKGGNLTIKENGHILCKKFVSSNPVNIDVYKYGHYVFGGQEKIFTAAEGAKVYSTDNRIFMSSEREGDILTVNITFSPVHCSDEGSFSLNFTDGADVQVEVEVKGILETCDLPKSVSLFDANDFTAMCAWCPNHKVINVTVSHVQNANYDPQTAELTGGSTSPQFPVYIDMTGKFSNSKVTVNMTVESRQEYGLLIVKLSRTGVACDYGEFYEFEANDDTGNGTKKHIQVTVTATASLTLLQPTDIGITFQQRNRNTTVAICFSQVYFLSQTDRRHLWLKSNVN